MFGKISTLNRRYTITEGQALFVVRVTIRAEFAPPPYFYVF